MICDCFRASKLLFETIRIIFLNLLSWFPFVPLPRSPLQVGTLQQGESYILTRVRVSTFHGRKQVTMGVNSRAVLLEDIGDVSDKKVDQPGTSNSDGPGHFQVITGEIEVVEYFESFLGCIKCKGKVHPVEDSAYCQKCNVAFKIRRGTRKTAARVQIRELLPMSPPESSPEDDDEGQSTPAVAAAVEGKLVTATMFEREVGILLGRDVSQAGHSDADMKMLLLAAPVATFKVDHRNVVLDVKLCKK